MKEKTGTSGADKQFYKMKKIENPEKKMRTLKWKIQWADLMENRGKRRNAQPTRRQQQKLSSLIIEEK